MERVVVRRPHVDVGHGHKKNLKEIELKNAHGVYLDSKTADLGAAMEDLKCVNVL